MIPPDRLRRAAAQALAIALSALFLLPFVLMLGTALHPPDAPPPTGFRWWPQQMSLEALRQAFTLTPMARGLLNSGLIIAFALPLTVLTASAAAYALCQLPPQRQRLWLTLLLLSASIPLTAVWIPRFLMFQQLGLVGGPLPLIAPALAGGSPLFVLLYFAAIRRVPVELFETARIEGLPEWRIWWQVALPLVRPTSFAVALLATVLFWGNFMEALLYLREEHTLTAPLMLHALDLFDPGHYPVLIAGAFAITAPLLLLYVLLQPALTRHQRGPAWFGR